MGKQIDLIIIGITATGQSGSVSSGNEGVLHIP